MVLESRITLYFTLLYFTLKRILFKEYRLCFTATPMQGMSRPIS